MATSYSNFFNNSNGFGVNVKKTETSTQTHVEQQKQQQQQQQLNIETSGFLKPVEKFVATVKDVFNGNVANELNKYRAMNFNTELILHEADVKINGQKPVFDITI